jgi:hypothetical protein
MNNDEKYTKRIEAMRAAMPEGFMMNVDAGMRIGKTAMSMDSMRAQDKNRKRKGLPPLGPKVYYIPSPQGYGKTPCYKISDLDEWLARLA